MRTSKTFCVVADAQRTLGLSQLYGMRAPFAGSDKHGPPVVVSVPPSPGKSVLGSPVTGAAGSLRGVAGKSVHPPFAQAPPSPPPGLDPSGKLTLGESENMNWLSPANVPPSEVPVPPSPNPLPLAPVAQLAATEIVDATVSASSKPYFTRDRTGSNTEASMRTSDAGGIRERRPHERTTVTEGERGKSPPSHYVGRFWSDAWLTKAL